MGAGGGGSRVLPVGVLSVAECRPRAVSLHRAGLIALIRAWGEDGEDGEGGRGETKGGGGGVSCTERRRSPRLRRSASVWPPRMRPLDAIALRGPWAKRKALCCRRRNGGTQSRDSCPVQPAGCAASDVMHPSLARPHHPSLYHTRPGSSSCDPTGLPTYTTQFRVMHPPARVALTLSSRPLPSSLPSHRQHAWRPG